MQSYRELIVWQRAVDLVVEVYRITKKFPREELFVLVSQMRRAAISIPSNIAEGYARRSRKEYIQFVQTSFGSAAELETQLEISRRLDYLEIETFNKLSENLTDVQKMLHGLLSSLKKVTKP